MNKTYKIIDYIYIFIIIYIIFRIYMMIKKSHIIVNYENFDNSQLFINYIESNLTKNAKNLIIITHTELGDIYIMNGAIRYYSTIYDSTNKTIEKLNVRKGELAAEICAYEGTVRANYYIRQAAICGVKKYENLINMDVIGEEIAAFTYRETCGRKKRLDLQKIYDTQILDQIQATSTINGNMLAAKQLVPPVLQPINLNTAAILTTNDSIKSVQISFDTFPNIYNSYTAHSTILAKINASIETESNSYSTIAMLSTNLLLQPGISSLIRLALDNEYNRYIEAVNTTASLKQNAELTRLAIDTAKAVYTNSIKTTVFPLNEQLTNEATISSFLKEGWDSAVTLQTGASGP